MNFHRDLVADGILSNNFHRNGFANGVIIFFFPPLFLFISLRVARREETTAKVVPFAESFRPGRLITILVEETFLLLEEEDTRKKKEARTSFEFIPIEEMISFKGDTFVENSFLLDFSRYCTSRSIESVRYRENSIDSLIEDILFDPRQTRQTSSSDVSKIDVMIDARSLVVSQNDTWWIRHEEERYANRIIIYVR